MSTLTSASNAIVRKYLYWGAIAGLILAIGLVYSIWVTFHMGPDADKGDTALLWYGVHEYGLSFLKSWSYTPDNWLLSLCPLHFLLFELFSPTFNTVTFSGVLIFWLNLCVCGWIAKILGAHYTMLIVPIVLLFSSVLTYEGTFLVYPVTHNITNLYGLLCILLAIKWIKTPHFSLLILILIVAFCGGLSDPWFLPCYAIPIVFSSLILRQTLTPKLAYWLAGTMSLAILLIYTRGLGLFHFLFKGSFGLTPLNELLSRLWMVIKSLAALFNIIPGSLGVQPTAAVFSLVIFLVLLCLVPAKLKSHRDDPGLVLFMSIAISSMLIILTNFWLYKNSFDYQYHYLVVRYILNVIFLLVLVLSMGAEIVWQTFSRVIKIAFITVGFLYVITGLSSSALLWRQPLATGANGLMDFLSSNHLYYGYADYWQGNLITWLSQDKIRVRPVIITQGLIKAHKSQTNKLWYLPGDRNRDQQNSFIIIKNQPDEYANIVRQFGAPEKKLTYADNLILVWSHPIKVSW